MPFTQTIHGLRQKVWRMMLAIPLFIMIEVMQSEICTQINDTTMRQGLVNQRRAFAVWQGKRRRNRSLASAAGLWG